MRGKKAEYEHELVSCDTFVVMPDLSGSGEVRRSFLERTLIDPRERFRKLCSIQHRSMMHLKNSSAHTLTLTKRRKLWL